ncbi:FAD binding domain-containing protein [Sarocladium implicatum]|nr:FAD binding domain-containing protein [Sarocladium implicatum]
MTDMRFSVSTSSNKESQPRWKQGDVNTALTAKVLRKMNYADKEATLRAVDEIRALLGDDAVSLDQGDLDSHGHSETSFFNPSTRPIAIIRPQSTEHVAFVAKICTKYMVPMVPYAAGSSVEGNSSSPYSGICIDVSSMDKIIEFHPEDMDVVVQPGVNWVDLNGEIKDTGLFLPLDPSPSAMIGGMISTNCSGTNAMRYGSMKDYVVSLTIVLADGSIIKTRNRPRKTSAGYNLNALFTGSEGTLGIITEATLKLVPVPTNFSVATVTFDNVRVAAAAAAQMVRDGIPLAALELMDSQQMRIVNENGGVGGRTWTELPTLFIKFSGSQNTVNDSLAGARQLAESHRCKSFQEARDEESMESLWSARKQALLATLASLPKGTTIRSTDVAVPLSRMADLIGTDMILIDQFNDVQLTIL